MPDVVYRKRGPKSDYIVLKSATLLGGEARNYGSQYAHFRLLEVDHDCTPRMGSARARGVIRVIDDSAPVFYGKGIRSEGAGVLARMKTDVDKLAKEEA